MTASWFSKLLRRAIKSNNMKKITSFDLGIHGKDAERAFSSLKWVKDERQRGMHEESHIAAVLLHCNGVVPS